MVVTMTDWTHETLRIYIEEMINSRYNAALLLMNERVKLLDERFLAQNDALARADHALERAQGAANEWRGALEDSRARFVTRTEWDSAHRELGSRLSSEIQLLTDRIDGVRQNVQAVDTRLVRLESRTGYMSVTIALSVMSLFVAVGVGIVSFFHSLPVGTP